MWVRVIFVVLVFAAHQASAKGVDAENSAITASLSGEPPTLDSSISEDSESNFILSQVKEGLVNVDHRGKLVPGVAERWEVTDTGATFYLRPNAKWSDGKQVTAHDFEYAWQRTVTPTTGASGSTFMYFVLDNALEIIQGKQPPSALGVKTIDDLTLKVTTSQYVPYIVQTMAAIPFSPQRKDMVEKFGDAYAAEARNQLFNGPFEVVEWVHDAKLVLKRNPHYWNQNDLDLETIDFGYITSDQRALFNLFQSDELATLQINNTILEDVSNAGVRLRKKPNNCNRMLTLNLREERATGNLNLRKALLHSFDGNTYVNRILAMPGVTRLDSMYGDNIESHKEEPFSTTYPSPFRNTDAELAQEYLAKAKEETGELPKLVLLSREGNEKQDEYLQALFKRELGLDVQIDRQAWKQAIEKLINGEFDIAFSGFCNGSLTDPYIVARTFESSNPFNDGKFNSERYDELLKQTTTLTDPVARMEIFRELEQIAFDAAIIIPTHHESDLYVQDNRLRRIAYGPAKDFSRGVIRD